MDLVWYVTLMLAFAAVSDWEVFQDSLKDVEVEAERLRKEQKEQAKREQLAAQRQRDEGEIDRLLRDAFNHGTMHS